MKVIVLEPGKAPEVRVIENNLQAYQALVGGLVCVALNAPRGSWLPKNRVDVICNDEGLLLEMELCAIRKTDGAPLVGNLFACKVVDTDEGADWAGFADDEIPPVMEGLREWLLRPWW